MSSTKLTEQKKLSINTELTKLTVEYVENGRIAITINGQTDYLELFQAQFLKLWLMEHLK